MISSWQSVSNSLFLRFSVNITGNTSNASNSCIHARNASDASIAGGASNASEESGKEILYEFFLSKGSHRVRKVQFF